MSIYNYEAMKCREEFGENSEKFTQLMNSHDNIDTVLHPIGEMQCHANKEAVHCLNVKYVLVSPLRRTIQTCILMFKNHPQKKDIKFILVPILREVLHTLCDVPTDVHCIMEQFAQGKEACHGIDFDFTLLKANGDPQLWTVNVMTNPKKNALFYSKMV